jgi:hypothetical protein
VRHLARLASVFPLRCRHCETRFWRLTFAPPPVARPRRRGAFPVGRDSDVVPGHADESSALPAHG